MNSRFAKKAIVAGLASAIAMTTGLAAFAYWSATGAGVGTASTEAGRTVVITQTNVVDDLEPGQLTPDNLVGNLTVSTGTYAYVGTIFPIVTGTSNPGCTANDFTVTPGTYNAEVNGEADGVTLGTIVFNDTASNQDACKGVTVNLSYDSVIISTSPPGAPTGLMATTDPHNGYEDLSWTPPTNSVGSTVDQYNVRYSSDGGATWTYTITDSPAPRFSLTHLAVGTSYEIEVAAQNTAGLGDYSSAATATPVLPNTYSAPTGLSATSGDDMSVPLSWTAPYDVNPDQLYGYSIRYSTDGTNWTYTRISSSDTSATITGLLSSGPYEFEVAAVSLGGTGAYSDAQTASPAPPSNSPNPDATAPDPPTDVYATNAHSGQNYLNMAWTPPASDGGSAITGYSIRFLDAGGNWESFDTNSANPSYTFTGLNPNSGFIIWVSALNAVGQSSYAQSILYTQPYATQPQVSAPTFVDVGPTSATLTWTEDTAVDSCPNTYYLVQVSQLDATGTPITTNMYETEFAWKIAAAQDLTPNTHYRVSVMGVNCVGVSAGTPEDFTTPQ